MFIILPIVIGLISNILFLPDYYLGRFVTQFIFFLFSIIPILGAINSYLSFTGNKQTFNYAFSLILIGYIQFLIIMAFGLSNDSITPTSIWLIGVYLLYMYSIYLFFTGATIVIQKLRFKWSKFLSGLNIHIINNKSEKVFINQLKELNEQYNNDSEKIDFSKIGIKTDVEDLVKVIQERTLRITEKIKYTENELLRLSKNRIEENEKLIQIQNEINQLEKLKNITEEQIDILLKRQNDKNVGNLVIGALFGAFLGIFGSVLANWITNYFAQQ